MAEPTPIASDWSTATKLWNHARSVLRNRAYTYYEYGSSAFGKQLDGVLAGAPIDLIHLDSLDLHRWLDALPRAPTACTHHSIESDLLRLRAGKVRRGFVRRYLLHQANLVEQIERSHCGTFDINVMMSETDALRLRALAPDARTVVIPNGVDTDYFRPAADRMVRQGMVVFLGPTYMFPNRDAVDFFLGDIWPRVRERVPQSSLHLIGKSSPQDRARFERHSEVTCYGYVPDIRTVMASAACSIVPIRVGGGTRLKILDAWGMGLAVVSTSVGCEGLKVQDGENILVRDDAAEFADAVVRLLSDEGLRERIERNARQTVERHYGWETIGQRLRHCYNELLATGKGVHTPVSSLDRKLRAGGE